MGRARLLARGFGAPGRPPPLSVAKASYIASRNACPCGGSGGGLSSEVEGVTLIRLISPPGVCGSSSLGASRTCCMAWNASDELVVTSVCEAAFLSARAISGCDGGAGTSHERCASTLSSETLGLEWHVGRSGTWDRMGERRSQLVVVGGGCERNGSEARAHDQSCAPARD